MWGLVVAVHGLNNCGSQALEKGVAEDEMVR